ncbi:MAG: hypothetical protein ACI4DS_05175 [Eubacterium sp.]
MENNKLTNRQKAVSIFAWTIKKYLPVQISYWILLILAYPIVDLLALITVIGDPYNSVDCYIEDMEIASPIIFGSVFSGIAIIYSIILSMVIFSYMHNKRAMDLFGSMPISRRGLVFAKYFATLAICILPVIVIGLIGMILSLNGAGMLMVLKHMLMLILGIIANVTVILFISLCCGTISDMLIGYFAINIAYPIVAGICYMFPMSVIPGMTNDYIWSSIFTLACPIAAPYVGMFGTGKVLHIVWWIVVSIVLIVACYALCKKRKSEIAQNTYAFSAVEIAVKIIVCFGAGFILGYVFSYVGYSFDTIIAQYVWFFIGAVIGIMVANILLHLIFHRGMSRYVSSLKLCAGELVLVAAFLFMVTTGYFGYDTRVPEVDDVSEVAVTGGYEEDFYVNGENILEPYTDNKEDIQSTVEFHKQMVKSIKEKNKGLYPIISDTDYYSYGSEVKIVYKLKNGTVLKRMYANYSEYEVEKSPVLTDISDIDKIQLIPAKYFNDCYVYDNNITYYEESDSYYEPRQYYRNESAETSELMDELLEAIIKDKDLVKTYDDEIYTDEYFEILLYYDNTEDNIYYSHASADIIITEECTNVIEVLKKMGIYETML